MAERLRQSASEIAATAAGDERISITISIGVAEISKDDANIEDALNRADDAMYQAKTAGRNRVVLA